MSVENNQIVNYEVSNFLTFEELCKLINSDSAIEKSDIIKSRLRKHLIINHKELYIYEPKSITYYKIIPDDSMDEFLLLQTRTLIVLSCCKLSIEQKEILDKFDKGKTLKK